jgi:hypothetical protein
MCQRADGLACVQDQHPHPDDRWGLFIGGVDASGQPLPMTYDVLASVTTQWPTTTATPVGIAGLLTTARAAFALAWFQYELLVVAGAWSLLAVEAALRERVDANDHRPFKALLAQAGRDGLFSAAQLDRLDAGRQLRNQLLHPREQQAWTLGMAAPIVEASHEVIALLYPDD